MCVCVCFSFDFLFINLKGKAMDIYRDRMLPCWSIPQISATAIFKSRSKIGSWIQSVSLPSAGGPALSHHLCAFRRSWSRIKDRTQVLILFTSIQSDALTAVMSTFLYFHFLKQIDVFIWKSHWEREWGNTEKEIFTLLIHSPTWLEQPGLGQA